MKLLNRTRLLTCFALVAVCLTVTTPSRANVFEVQNITVDVEAETAAAARDQALALAERRAFYALINRLTRQIDQDRIPNFGRSDIAPYVRDFSVAQEKSSSVRYIATLNFRFKPDEIRNLLRAYGVPFAETRAKPQVILPIYEVGARAVLWDEPNPWRTIWRERSAPEGLVPLILPLGDLTDISTVGAPDALAGDSIKLGAIANRYNAAATIVAHVNLAVSPTTGEQQATVTLRRPGEPFPPEVQVETYSMRQGETENDFLSRLSDATVQRIEEYWKSRNLISSDVTGVFAVTVPIAGLQDWLSIKEQLGRIGIVRKSEIVLMSREQVRVNIHYAGNPDQLSTALEQANLSLLQEGGEWIVMPIGAFAPPRT